MPVYSFSQIRIFQECPLRYRYQYVDKLPKGEEEMQSPHLLLGSTVHEVLERLYKQLNQYQQVSRADMLAWFEEIREKDIDYDAISFPEGQSEEAFLARGKAYVGQYRDKHAPFDTKETKVVMTEGMLMFSLDQETGIKFRGIVDRLDKQGETFIIHDYKTNKTLPDEDTEYYREQLTLYGLGVQQKYGKYLSSIRGKLHYLHFDTYDERDIDQESVKNVSKKYQKIVKNIEHTRFQYNMGNADVFPAQENTGCSYCPYKSICPLWSHAGMDDEIILGDNHVSDLVDEYADISSQISNLEKQKKLLKEILSEYAKNKKLKKLFGKEFQITAGEQTYYGVKDLEQLEQYLQDKGLIDDIKKVDRFALARAIKEGTLDLSELSGSVEEKKSLVLRSGVRKDG